MDLAAEPFDVIDRFEGGRNPDVAAHVIGDVSTGLVRCTELLYPPGLEIPEHSHVLPSIWIVFAGRVEEIVAGIRFCLEASSIYTRPGGIAHSNVFGAEHLRGLLIELERGFVERYPAAADLVRHPAIFHGAPILATASALSNEVRRARTRSVEVSVDALCLTLVSQLIRKGEGSPASPTTAWVSELVAFLKRNFRGHLSVNDLASKFELHPSYLGRVFKREMQLSVMEYVRKLRVEHASNLLSSTDMALSEISDVCAFADQAHFTRVFKSVVGTTPRAYRRLSRKPTISAGENAPS